MKRSFLTKLFLFLAFGLFFLCAPIVAQNEKAASDMSELAKQSQNPVANMYQLPVSYLGDFNSGVTNSYISTVMLKPVIPVTLSKNLLFIFRAIAPVTFMPAPINKTGLSDIQLQFYLSPASKSKFIWGAGPMISVPSGIPSDMCSGKWTVGPAAAGLFMLKHWVIGVLATQRWTFAGNGSMPDINQLYIDAFANYNFKHGWALGYTPEIYVNWNQPDDAWNLPVGLNVSKVFKIGKQPLSANLAWYYNVIRPADYPDMYIKAGLTFLFPKKAK
jgi:hypothetical protein